MLLIVLCLCIKNVWKSTTWLPWNVSHSCPTLPQRIMGQQVLSSCLKKKKVTGSKKKHLRTQFMQLIIPMPCSWLRNYCWGDPRPSMLQAKNFPLPSSSAGGFWHYSFDGTLYKNVSWLNVYVCMRDGGLCLNNQNACSVSFSMQRLLIAVPAIFPIFCWHYHFHSWNQLRSHPRTSRLVIWADGNQPAKQSESIYWLQTRVCFHPFLLSCTCLHASSSWHRVHLCYCVKRTGVGIRSSFKVCRQFGGQLCTCVFYIFIENNDYLFFVMYFAVLTNDHLFKVLGIQLF